MLTLYDPTSLRLILERIHKLQPDAARRWGTMEPAQMLAHCAAAMEMATGDTRPHRYPAALFGGWWTRNSLTNSRPFRQNLPTHPTLKVADARDFAAEKTRLLSLIKRFTDGGPEQAPRMPHYFFGYLSATEWGGWCAKHLDHHLRQFGA